MTTRRGRREARRRRSHRIRAVLAGGLVFGIGAAATLAAWNDAEFATATFQAGRFGIVGATDGTAFTDHATAGSAAALTFALAPTAMAPGSTTYALFSVKTANPSVAGTVQLTAGTPGGTGLATYLTYGVRTIAGTSCSAATYPAGTAVVADGSVVTANGSTTQAVAANGVGQVNYCIAVTLPTTAPNAAQGLTMSQTWQFAGTSA